MPTGTLETLEQRLTALEREMIQVKEQLEAQQAQQPNPWLDYVYGAFKDDPLFEQAVQYGREWRESQDGLDGEEEDGPAGHG